ncbi:hypothetical protein [Rossellomorea aquimaris]|uniref:hypothetical protein n=1 Tax=Rossellomorea aquimaris TaxID=189382 RepID=UPI0007D0B5BE|nr:hypothetical protein [Rossellomorea aquimaris]
MRKDFFVYDARLKLNLPHPTTEWNVYSSSEQETILLEWEKIRGKIPDRIGELDKEIEVLQNELGVEEDFEISCKINDEIASKASRINDLWIWYRTNPAKSS